MPGRWTKEGEEKDGGGNSRQEIGWNKQALRFSNHPSAAITTKPTNNKSNKQGKRTRPNQRTSQSTNNLPTKEPRNELVTLRLSYKMRSENEQLRGVRGFRGEVCLGAQCCEKIRGVPRVCARTARPGSSKAAVFHFLKHLFDAIFLKCFFAESSLNQQPLALGEIRRSIWSHFVMKLPSKKIKNHKK